MSLINDVIKVANSKLASMSKSAAEEDMASLPFTGVDTKTIPNVGAQLRGIADAPRDVRVSPASMGLRAGLSSGFIPGGFGPAIADQVDNNITPVLAGRPGNRSNLGIAGFAPSPRPTPILSAKNMSANVESMLRNNVPANSISDARSALVSKMQEALNSPASRDNFVRAAAEEYSNEGVPLFSNGTDPGKAEAAKQYARMLKAKGVSSDRSPKFNAILRDIRRDADIDEAKKWWNEDTNNDPETGNTGIFGNYDPIYQARRSGRMEELLSKLRSSYMDDYTKGIEEEGLTGLERLLTPSKWGEGLGRYNPLAQIRASRRAIEDMTGGNIPWYSQLPFKGEELASSLHDKLMNTPDTISNLIFGE